MERGHEVVIVTARDEYSEALVREGVTLEEVVINRGGLSPVSDARLLFRLAAVYRRSRPDIIHHFHGKPVILGTLAARFTLGGKVSVVNTITGLGHAFISGGFVRLIAGMGYRVMRYLVDCIIFQNADDMSLFRRNGWADSEKSRLILSSGVDTDRYKPAGKSGSNPKSRVLFVGRLLWQKGLGEYLKAISLLKPKYQDVSFEIAGEFDLIHPDAVSEDVIRDMENRGEGRYLGYLTNLDEVYPSVDLIVLPSYREGVPRVVLEAAACGVATVGADVPGTREAIRDGETGMLVPVKDVEALAAAIASLLDDREKLKLLGANARKMIVQQFDIREITEKQITVYTDLGLR